MNNYNLSYKVNLLVKILFFYFITSLNSFATENNEIKNITEGDENAKIEILIYESLTCPHCAEFHKKIYPD